jgi:hypothetical protein
MKLLLAVLALISCAVTTAWADGPNVVQSTCVASWDAPQTNTDGTNLSNLLEYRFYGAPDPATLLQGGPDLVIPAAQPDPPAGQRVSVSCSSSPLGQRYFAVSAVNSLGVESALSTTVAVVIVTAAPSTPSAPVGLGIQ